MKKEDIVGIVEKIKSGTGLPTAFNGGTFEAFKLGLNTAISVFEAELLKPEDPDKKEKK
jgi:hypothetical protein